MAPAMPLFRRTEAEIPRPSARAGSDRTIRRAGRTSATTACGILAREFTERSIRGIAPPHAAGANSSLRCPYGRPFPTQITFTPISLAESAVRNRMLSGVASVKNLAASVLSPRLLA
jgi:hypothetical protein